MKTRPVILCVDDEDAILRSLKRSFFDSDVEILTAGSARDALDCLRECSIDMIVTDYMMPEMNGLELLKKVREKFPRVLRVVISGYVEKHVIVESLIDYTAVAYFSKPWNDELLNLRLRELLDLKRSVKDDRLWAMINNVFPVPAEEQVSKRNYDRITAGEMVCGEQIRFVKRDIFSYIKLLHLANTDYVKRDPVVKPDKLIEIPGCEYFAGYVKTCSLYKHGEVIFMYHLSGLVLESYPELFRRITGKEELPEFYEYAVLVNIENMIRLSVSPVRFYDGICPSEPGDRELEGLVDSLFRFLNIPGELLRFYTAFRNIRLDSDGDMESSTDLYILKVITRLASYAMLEKPPKTTPSWWKWEKSLYTETAAGLTSLRMSQL